MAEQPRSRAFTLDRVDTKAIGASTLKSLAALVVSILPLFAMGFDSNTTIGAAALLVIRQGGDFAARWMKNNA